MLHSVMPYFNEATFFKTQVHNSDGRFQYLKIYEGNVRVANCFSTHNTFLSITDDEILSHHGNTAFLQIQRLGWLTWSSFVQERKSSSPPDQQSKRTETWKGIAPHL